MCVVFFFRAECVCFPSSQLKLQLHELQVVRLSIMTELKAAPVHPAAPSRGARLRHLLALHSGFDVHLELLDMDRLCVLRALCTDTHAAVGRYPVKMVEEDGGVWKESFHRFLTCFPAAAGWRLNGVTDTDLAAFPAYEHCRELQLSYCSSISDHAFVHRFPQLQTLELHGRLSQLTDAALGHLPHLRRLNLDHCENITDAAFLSVTQLEELILRGCDRITDAGLACLSQLRVLELTRDCRGITHVGLVQLPLLRKLVIESCPEIDGRALLGMPQLTALNIANNWNLRDEHLANLPQLRELNMRYCRGISRAVFARLPLLERLDIHGCFQNWPWPYASTEHPRVAFWAQLPCLWHVTLCGEQSSSYGSYARKHLHLVDPDEELLTARGVIVEYGPRR